MENVSWTIEEPIGDIAGFGAVHRSHKKIEGVLQQENYVIKILKHSDEDSVKRFQREIRMLAKLNHPRIVKVEGYRLTSEPYFYAMSEYKGSLNRFIADIGGDYKRTKDIFNAIFDGVEYLHDQGVYHRDLKPQNVLMNSDTDLVISDLGLGVDLTSESQRLTRTGDGAGTHFYSAPEQWDNLKHVDERADIYSLGAMIYTICTSSTKTPLFSDYKKLPAGINLVVERCMKQKPEERFGNISELRDSFNLAMDYLIGGSQKDDLNSLMTSLTSITTIDASLVDRLAYALFETKNDSDLVHDNLMKLPADVFRIMAEHQLEIAKELIEIFVGHVTGQGWPFDYTDKIGNQCQKLFFAVTDITIRAKLLYATLEVGVSHNRWYVMGLFEHMIKDVTDPTESFEVVRVLSPIKHMIDRLNNIRKSEVNTILQSIF